MIVYLTRDTTDFARELRARFLAEGHSVYTGDALAALPPSTSSSPRRTSALRATTSPCSTGSTRKS